MQFWHAIILGLVEGITEYLPVSSTGHLIVAAALLGLDKPETKSATDAFLIIVQGGAILAVLGLYRARVVQMIRGVLGRDPAGFRLAVNVLIAFLPAAVIGLLLEKHIERLLFGPGPVVLALAAGGVYMILLEAWRRGKFSMVRSSHAEIGIDELTPGRALVIGLMQCIAMWPGTSRSMMTITAGYIVRLRPAAAAEFSFLLGLPTLGGACAYKLFKDIANDGVAGHVSIFKTLGIAPVLLGIAVATVSAAIAIKWLVAFLNRHGLAPFGWYRLLLAAALLGLILGGIVVID
ncbi:MAG: undecaprenyl-diphosphate phosphatase [Phycisphaeraceae bacterium]|nr:undecaprenyl-diphosphate phosphatase [Phycisphaeraceae bacterium]MBX3405533.1 undecaprenyl-diphosphate phosphatase [Phycisphaeraceae bacterium]